MPDPQRLMVLTILLCVVSPSALAIPATSQMAQIDMPFIVNQGQFHEEAAFCAQTFNGSISITSNGEIHYVLLKSVRGASPIVLTESVIDGEVNNIIGEHPAATRISSFRGHDQSAWQRNIPAYDLLNLGEVVDGITLKLRAAGASAEKIFILSPGVEPERIRMAFTGATGLQVNEAGELVVETTNGAAHFTRPVAFQDIDGRRHELVADYVLTAERPNEYGFSVDGYDPTAELVIDPLYAATYLGGIGRDGEYDGDILLADDGCVYVTGPTSSEDFPVTPGAFDETYNGGFNYVGDVFVAKLDRYLTTLIAATFLGGSDHEFSTEIVLDGMGHLYVAGMTESEDFPVTPDSFDPTHNGGHPGGYMSDVFVAKLDMDLTTLIAGTFLGGTLADGLWSTVLLPMADGTIYVGGSTNSWDFPITPGVYDPYFNEGNDVFVSHFDGNLSTLLASTYMNSRGWDDCYGLELDPDGNIVITGMAGAGDWPTTPGVFQEEWVWYGDGYVSKLTPDLGSLVVSTYIGGCASDAPRAMALDEDGNIYIVGDTGSWNYPTTTNAYDQTYNGGYSDAFISVLSGDLTTLKASTFLGGYRREMYFNAGLVLDHDNGLYVCGGTQSINFPVTAGAFDEEYGGLQDIFVSRLDRGLTTLLASTFLGMSNIESGHALTLDELGNVYVYGETYSVNFPVTPNAHSQNHHSGGPDAFIAVFDPDLSASLMTVADEIGGGELSACCPSPYCPGSTIAFELPEAASVSIDIYDISGHRLRTILRQSLIAGPHTAAWDGEDAWGRDMATGLYLCRIQAGRSLMTERILLVR